MGSIAANLQVVRGRISSAARAAGRDPAAVSLLAVSKTHAPALIREALKYVPPERLVISSDCGMGREGMGRRHAAYKMVSMVLGTNTVRKELGLPEAECLAADPRYSLTETKG